MLLLHDYLWFSMTNHERMIHGDAFKVLLKRRLNEESWPRDINLNANVQAFG